jgi:hypothetical protein
MLRGSFAVGTGTLNFTRHGQIVQSDQQPAYRADLTHLVDSMEQNKSVLLPAKGKSTVRWADGSADMRSGRKRRLLCNGGDTGCARWIGNIIGRESGQTSLGCFIARKRG